MFEVGLTPGPGGRRFAWMRALSGRDELDLSQLTPGALTQLLARMLVAAPGVALGPDDVANASTADRDRLVAGLYSHAFGDRIESHADCAACGERFEFGFSLSALLADLDERAGEGARRYAPAGSGAGGFYDLGLGDDVRFRLPTVADELALRELAAGSSERASRALIERCVQREGGDLGAGEVPIAAVEAAMDAVAPLLSLELPVRCALCEHAQPIDFDLLEFLLAALARERPLLVREIHALARVYRWSFAEIVGLAREQRRALVEVITFAREGEEMAP